ncbi:MAG: thermonuclease family protein [Butyrivibrio sp.]|nr:thermonuclease family protein [Butyrivibrio sp.]
MKKKRRTRKKIKYTLPIAILSSLLIVIAFLLIKNTSGNISSKLVGPYDVKYVIDGDTFVADIDGIETHIRLIGIDTPESVSQDPDKENTEEGEIASEYTKSILEDNEVYLEYDSEILDVYGRTLCYVYLHDKKTMLNEVLLKNGYAVIMTIEPNTKYEERFLLDEHEAKKDKIGFWGTGFFTE